MCGSVDELAVAPADGLREPGEVAWEPVCLGHGVYHQWMTESVGSRRCVVT